MGFFLDDVRRLLNSVEWHVFKEVNRRIRYAQIMLTDFFAKDLALDGNRTGFVGLFVTHFDVSALF